jgi:hypothetical protein
MGFTSLAFSFAVLAAFCVLRCILPPGGPIGPISAFFCLFLLLAAIGGTLISSA